MKTPASRSIRLWFYSSHRGLARAFGWNIPPDVFRCAPGCSPWSSFQGFLTTRRCGLGKASRTEEVP